MPGEGELVYVAGPPDDLLRAVLADRPLKHGDPVFVELPYGTFKYRVTRHRDRCRHDGLGVCSSRGREVLALQACHPRFFATQRYIAYAEPVPDHAARLDARRRRTRPRQP